MTGLGEEQRSCPPHLLDMKPTPNCPGSSRLLQGTWGRTPPPLSQLADMGKPFPVSSPECQRNRIRLKAQAPSQLFLRAFHCGCLPTTPSPASPSHVHTGLMIHPQPLSSLSSLLKELLQRWFSTFTHWLLTPTSHLSVSFSQYQVPPWNPALLLPRKAPPQSLPCPLPLSTLQTQACPQR